jgi:hypothetical protein
MNRPTTVPTEPPEATPLPTGVVHVSEPLARVMIRLALAGVEPALELDDWTVILACSRRKAEELKSSGKLPPVDFYVGKCPRWHAATVREWLKGGGS